MILTLLFACSGEPNEAPVSALPAPTSAVPDALVGQTWQVRLAPDAARTAFEGRASWTAYFQGQRVEALAAMASESDPVGLARMHAELAALYDEAALVQARSVQQVYGVDKQATDPLEVAFLLGEAGVVLGDDALLANFGLSGASKVPGIAERDKAWKVWVDGGKIGPVDALLAATPGLPPGPPAPGTTPGLGPVPTYTLPELTPEQLGVSAADGLSAWGLARWHEQASILAAGATPDVGAAMLIAAHRAPGDRTPASVTIPTPHISDSTLFLGPYSTGGDLALAAELRSPLTAPVAVSQHVQDSPYAAIIQSCTGAGAPSSTGAGEPLTAGAASISVDCVVDQAAAFGNAVQDAMGVAAGGPQAFHRSFADQARAGVLRVAADAAFAAGDSDAGGRLRLNAIDRAVDKAYDPLFVLSVAAWDAGNRNSVRATEMVHPLVGQLPGLDVARLPLDALHVRLSRSAAPGVPMH